ncbi:DegT/DnrJ/EryC1/StrS family aminotransferase [Catenulispora sp. NL8]|uniref:DegT/DnrJ/EryC1/StrS family aminotransferase n=1 Tax=Catenulispora pinistramenti TaxID=2705254 RepID=A0ABS5KPT9_9ACTN|nr:DegT/DnrJ/EryC1/StrS family aminotransferase [Catenulispora pinistramenti]MBS2548004.1 DegT/DnrJ/EryC1/StrS family aminotransferase [Catenulispora pinistramenti]
MPLALHGGTPVRTEPLPTSLDSSGRILGRAEQEAVERVIASGVLWRVTGTEVAALETEFAALLGTAHAVASTSGTSALHLAVAAVNPEPGDEVIVPPVTDFGTVIAVLACNAVPVFADVDPVTGCLTPESVAAKITSRTRAVIAVHLFGGPAPIGELVELCRPRGITVIEDCAQAYLTVPHGGTGYAGTRGDIGCFSLQQTKHITAGDGGLTVTDDPELARRMRLFADKGWPRDTGERTHLFLGLNYRMTELVGAVARVQLTRLGEIVAARRAVAARLTKELDGLAGLRLPSPEEISRHSFWLYPILLDPELVGTDNADFGAALLAEGIPASAGYLDRPVYLTPAMAERRTYGISGFPIDGRHYAKGDCPVAEDMIERTLVVLQCNERYSDQDVDDIITAVRRVHAHFAHFAHLAG